MKARQLRRGGKELLKAILKRVTVGTVLLRDRLAAASSRSSTSSPVTATQKPTEWKSIWTWLRVPAEQKWNSAPLHLTFPPKLQALSCDRRQGAPLRAFLLLRSSLHKSLSLSLLLNSIILSIFATSSSPSCFSKWSSFYLWTPASVICSNFPSFLQEKSFFLLLPLCSIIHVFI